MNNLYAIAGERSSLTETDSLDLVIQLLPVATLILSEKGKTVRFANAAFRALFNQESYSDHNGILVFSELLNPKVKNTIDSALELGVSVTVEGVTTGLSGSSHRIMNFHAAPISVIGQKEPDLLLTILDTTIRVQAVKKFDETERSYRSLMESMAVAVYTCDMDGKVNFYNDAAVTLWGRVPILGVELWCGSYKMFSIDGSYMPHDQCPAAISLREKRAVRAEALVQRPDGNMRHVLVFPRPAFDHEGNMTGLINAVIDITERKALERQKDDFMGIVAHELKTPLTSVKGFAQILLQKLEKTGDAKFLEIQGRMEVQLDNLSKLIDRMLNAAKIESGELEFKKERFDLSLLVNNVVQNIQLATRTHKLNLVRSVPMFVNGDLELTEQVIINLLSNAIKYSPHKDIVTITVISEGGRVICSIKDYGFGIPDDQLSNIFEKYYRVKAENMNRLPGIGLGLYLSAEIVRQQGGQIWAESKEDEGSTFYFNLPAEASA